MVSANLKLLVSAAAALSLSSIIQGAAQNTARDRVYTCTIAANGDGSDDAPTIRDAFDECQSNARIVFENTTYYINSPLNTTTLSNWSNDTDYWLDHSMPIGYQNQSTVWFLGGSNINVNGYGSGTFDGNGQVWYDLVKGESNYPNRPMGLTIWGAADSSFKGLNFVQSQMWTMTIMHSSNVLMEDIYVNSTSHSGNPARNTDGLDTLFSDIITLRRWLVDNGDDGISLKANSTNVVLEDSVLRRGQGLALGSIGQYEGAFETIENVTVRNVSMIDTNFAVNVKTWTGDQVDYPPNGGGGGLGYIKNVTIQDITLQEVRSFAVNIGQCTAYDGASDKDCDSSLFHIGNITFNNFTGDLAGKYVGNMQCSEAAGGCDGIEFGDIGLTKTSADTAVDDYKCSNVVDPIGFEC